MYNKMEMIYISRKCSYTNEELIQTVKSCYSFREVARKLNLSQDGGGTIKHIKKKINDLCIDISHFTGQGWNNGKTHRSNQDIHNKYTDDECFCKNSIVSPKFIRERILQLNLIKYCCEICGLSDIWNGKEIVLELDHIDGDVYNNTLENLRFLCPNCHSQTSTYKNKTKTKDIKYKTEEEVLMAIKNTNNIRQALIYLNLSPKGDNYSRIREIMTKYDLIQ